MNDETGREMPKYNCHKQVNALKIESVTKNHNKSIDIFFEDKSFAPVNIEDADRLPEPSAGWYYVVYKNGYKSFSPPEAFEEGYSPAGAVGLSVAPEMRAKMRVVSAISEGQGENKSGEMLSFSAVGKKGAYGEDGLDENNTYAKFTPSGSADLYVTNPALFDQFTVDDEHYVDFTKAAD